MWKSGESATAQKTIFPQANVNKKKVVNREKLKKFGGNISTGILSTI